LFVVVTHRDAFSFPGALYDWAATIAASRPTP